MRLAYHLKMPVWRVKLEIPTREFLAWQAYERILPFDIDAARICQAVFQAAGAKDVDLMDFTLFGRGKDWVADVGQMMQAVALSGAVRTQRGA